MICTRARWAAAVAAGLALTSAGTLATAQEERDEQQRQATERDDADRGQDGERDAEEAAQREQDRASQDRDRDSFRQSRQPGQPDEGQPAGEGRRQGVMLGVSVDSSPTTGVLIRDVLPGSAAEQAGLRPGDYILAVDEERITSPEQFSQQLGQMQPGGQAGLTIWRNDQEQRLSVNLVEQQQSRFRAPGQAFDQGQPLQEQQFQGQPAQDGRTFQQGRRQSQAWLGVILSEQQDDQQRGVRVMQIYPSGPAARAGIRSGDLITRIEDQQVSRAEDLVNAIERRQPGEQIELSVGRGEDEEQQEQPLDVTLGDRSAFFGDDQFPQQREQQSGDRAFSDFDQFAVPEHAMMLEQHRHLASQHQRIERLLLELRQEVQTLRQEVQALSGQRQGRGASGPSTRTAPGLPQPPDDAAGFGQPVPQQRRTLRPGAEAGSDRGFDRQPQPGLNPTAPRAENRSSPNATAP